MNNQRSWVEALNIKPESLSQWSAEAPAGKPLLVWCLEQGHIPFENYVHWAQEFFGLPTLDSSFFNGAMDSQLLEQSRTDGVWHPWCFPVDKWDDITIVACTEPPTDQDHPQVVYVLADPRAMSEAWGPSHSQVNIPPLPNELPTEEVPQGFTIATKPFVLNIDDSLFATPPNPTLEVEPPAPAPAPTPTKVPKLKVVSNAPEAEPKPPQTQSAAPANEEEAVGKAFAEILTKYNYVALMKCTDNKAKLYRAGPGLSVSEKLKAVDLSYPTFLRIVVKTALPYHGYLIDSPAHRDFFEGLGLKELPGCVTSVPIKSDGKVLGMLVAIGSTDLLKADYLGIVGQAAAHLSQAVSAAWASAS